MKRNLLLVAIVLLVGFLAVSCALILHDGTGIVVGPPIGLGMPAVPYYAGPYWVDGGNYWYWSGGFYTYSGGYYHFHHYTPLYSRGYYNGLWNRHYQQRHLPAPHHRR